MGLNRRLDTWLREGIIDADTAERIAAFEESRKRPTALYALVGLGALAIGIGLISIIAANWDAIPASAKLAVDLLAGAGLALAIHHQLERGGGWGAEALLIVYYLFVLASIGLIGQVYQLGSPLHTALGVWSLATLPLLFLAKSRFAGVLWAAGLVTTYILDAVDRVEQASDPNRVDLALTCGVALPVLLFGASGVLRRASDKVSRTFREIAWATLVILAFLGAFGWYANIELEHRVTWGAVLSLALVAVPILFRRPLFEDQARAATLGLTVLVAATVPPLALTHPSLELLGGMLGLAVLALFALLAYRGGHRTAFSLLTAAIGVRIITIYFEVFGSLMSTGLGLVTGGALTLLVAWLWARTSRNLKDDFERGGADAR